jgi:hypothetical protein
LNSGRIISTNLEPGVVAGTGTGGDWGKKILDDGFWMNFRQEDRICRKEVKKNLKLETGFWVNF